MEKKSYIRAKGLPLICVQEGKEIKIKMVSVEKREAGWGKSRVCTPR